MGDFSIVPAKHGRQRAGFGVIDMSNVGLGDCLTALSVLYYLCRYEPGLFADRCIVAVPPALLGVAHRIFADTVVTVAPGYASERVQPRGRKLHMRAPRSPSELLRQLLGLSNYLNWAEAHGLAVTSTSERVGGNLLKQLRFWCLELAQFKTIDWRMTAPLYVGLRMLFPLLVRTGKPLTWHVIKIKQTLRDVRTLVDRYCESTTNSEGVLRNVDGRLVLFPAAASFNAIPPAICADLQEQIPGGFLVAIPESEPWLSEYQRRLTDVVVIRSIEDTLELIRRHRVVCVDGFVSHLTQLVTDEALIIYNREPRERLTHPGASPSTLELYPECAPCSYKLRARSAACPAGRVDCVAYESNRAKIRLAMTDFAGLPPGARICR